MGEFVDPAAGDDVVQEALRQMERLDDNEQKRRGVADDKLGNLQNTIEFIVTLVAGSFVVATFQDKPSQLNAWRLLVYVALAAALLFFVWAATQITSANDPVGFEVRTAKGILRKVRETKTKRALLEDALSDYASMIDRNHRKVDERLTLYRAAIKNIIKGVYCLAAVPILFFASAFGGNGLAKHDSAISAHTSTIPRTIVQPTGKALRVSRRARPSLR